MPIYEYTCNECKRRFRKLVGVTAQASPLQCPRCQSQSVTRLISRFARVRSEDEAMDSLADELESVGDADDPKAVRRLMREMGREFGEDMEGDLDEMLEEEQSGGEESSGDTLD